MGSGSLEQSPVDGLSLRVLLVVIQQVFIEWRLQADLQVSGKEGLLAVGTARQRPEADSLATREECGR